MAAIPEPVRYDPINHVLASLAMRLGGRLNLHASPARDIDAPRDQTATEAALRID